MLIIPIGGADMPVVVSVLKPPIPAWAAAGIGFTLGKPGADHTPVRWSGLASGAILSYIMCKGMNRLLHLGDPLVASGGESEAAAAGGSKRGPSRRERRMSGPSS